MTQRLVGLLALALASAAAMPTGVAARQPSFPAPAGDARRDAADLAAFAHRADLSHDLGATQMNVTDGLPPARWELDRDDPYPEWFVHHASLLKIFPAAPVRPFIDANWLRHVQHVVTERCRILRAHGLKAVWSANEPSVLPEAFFIAHPDYRGPRIDQAERSRKVYFAPNTDNPDVRAMYRDSVAQLISACPEVDSFLWVTTDAGSGFDWAPSLYPGANGNSDHADWPLSDRVVAFMTNIQQAAAAAGHPVRINITPIEPRQWMVPTFGADVQENIIRKLPRGLAINGKEGPDGRPFDTGMSRAIANPFYPVVGLVVPSFAPVPAGSGARRGYNLGDEQSVDFTYRLLEATDGQPMATALERLAALRRFAAGEVGEAHADKLIDAWQALDDVRHDLEMLDFGGMLRFGHVLGRWIDRPMVPFPLELGAAEKADWRPFLFQARGEDQAADLVDIQAMRIFQGWGAHLLFQRDMELAIPRAERARQLIQDVAQSAPDPAARAYWTLTGKRVQALIYLLRSADDMVAYQAHLDRIAGLGGKPEPNPVLGVQSDWARTDMINIARREIDTSVHLAALLASTNRPLLDLAPTPGDETVMRLGPDVHAAILHKVATMNAHWRDYDRLFTPPNP